MTETTAVLYFVDGSEAEASLRSARDIHSETDGATMVPLTKQTWMKQIKSLPEGTICFLATHGGEGEDGTLQAYLRACSISHTHSSATTSSILANKHTAKLAYSALGIPTPPWVFAGVMYGAMSDTRKILQKPIFGGSKQGIVAVKSFGSDNQHIYEEIVPGQFEVSIAVVRDGSEHIPLFPIVRKRSMERWGDLRATHIGQVAERALSLCQEYAVSISKALDCYGIIKTDFLIGTREEVWVIETDVIPGLSRSNAAAEAAKKSGIAYSKLLTIIKETTWKPTS